MARPEQVLLLEPQHEMKFRGKRGGPGCGRGEEEEWRGGPACVSGVWEERGGTIREPKPVRGCSAHFDSIAFIG